MSVPTESDRSRALTAAAVVFFIVGLVVMAWNISLPLVAYSPGPTSDAVDAVVVEGAETFPPAGEMIMLTVQSQDLNVFEAILAGVDPTLDVLGRQVVRPPDESDEEYRRRNLQLMDQSTQTAIGVALARLDLSDVEQETFITGYAADTPAGAVLEIGDRIVSLEGTEIVEPDDLSPALEGYGPGDSVTIEVERDGELLDYDIQLDAFEEDPDRPFIGIVVRPLPYWIDVDSGIVGGPSAGMMYSLAIIDVLSPGNLTAGRVVAGTGTVDPEGNVGTIGGIRQKVVAAEAAGAEYMLVPSGNYDQALTAPRESLELVPVETVDEALEFLESLEPS